LDWHDLFDDDNFFSEDGSLNDLFHLKDLLDGFVDNPFDFLDDFLGSSVSLLPKVVVIDNDLGCGISCGLLHLSLHIFGFSLGLRNQLGDNSSGLFDLVALLDEGFLHVAYSIS
jgi:hypothetical protein